MPFYRVGDNLVHLKLSGRAKASPPKPCCVRTEPRLLASHGRPIRQCLAISAFLCDWPLESGGTCDAPLCEDHANQVGRNRHYCPNHFARYRENEPELF